MKKGEQDTWCFVGFNKRMHSFCFLVFRVVLVFGRPRLFVLLLSGSRSSAISSSNRV